MQRHSDILSGQILFRHFKSKKFSVRFYSSSHFCGNMELLCFWITPEITLFLPVSPKGQQGLLPKAKLW